MKTAMTASGTLDRWHRYIAEQEQTRCRTSNRIWRIYRNEDQKRQGGGGGGALCWEWSPFKVKDIKRIWMNKEAYRKRYGMELNGIFPRMKYILKEWMEGNGRIVEGRTKLNEERTNKKGRNGQME